MLYDFLLLSRTSAEPLCTQLYLGLRQGIESGRLAAGEKLASIRQASSELSVSRTTVENAYAQLCMEGYIEAKPQSGYRVRATLPHREQVFIPPAEQPIYDFTTSNIDLEAADLQNWKHLVRWVLANEQSLTSYGDPQGEVELRRALSAYAFRARGVLAEPENVFIGAGVGPLLQLLCPLFSCPPCVLMESPGFLQAEQIFRDYRLPLRICALFPDDLPTEENAVFAALPSFRPRAASAAVSAYRNTLLSWTMEYPGRYVLEDDYNGELHYRTRALPAFQGICPEKTIYFGSFSKLLVPSVRIAYMVLPPALAEIARSRLPVLNQTAGKTEQTALAEYIRTGLLEKHLRRLRRLYAKKSQLLASALDEVFAEQCTYTLHETALSFIMELKSTYSGQALSALAQEAKIACRPAPGHIGRTKEAQMILGFSGIAAEKIPEGIEALGSAWRTALHP